MMLAMERPEVRTGGRPDLPVSSNTKSEELEALPQASVLPHRSPAQ